MKCSGESGDGACKTSAKDCCAKRILELEPDFEEQKSLVQEILEKKGL